MATIENIENIVLTMVKYQDLGVVTYNEDMSAIEDIPLINRPIFFEYMVGKFNIDDFMNSNMSTVMGNCLGDSILIDAYVVQMKVGNYNEMLESLEGNVKELISEVFKNLFFIENGPVLHQGFYRYVINDTIYTLQN